MERSNDFIYTDCSVYVSTCNNWTLGLRRQGNHRILRNIPLKHVFKVSKIVFLFRQMMSVKGGILGAFTKFNKNSTSKYIICALYLLIIVNYLCAFQLYAMPAFDNFERIYTVKKNEPCPRWVRSAIKAIFGGVTYFVSVAIPFLPSLGPFTGSLVLPLTLAYPCLMWVRIKKPGRFSRMWGLNLGLGYSGIALSVLCAGAGLWSLIVNGLEANFFKP